MILPGLVRTVMAHPRWWARLPARIGYYIAPAQMPGNLISDSFSKEALDGSYWTHAQVLAENALYVAVALMLASIIFARREIRVR